MGIMTATPYIYEPVTRADLIIVCVAFGWYCGFTYWVGWTAIQQTRSGKFGGYITMVWLEILVCTTFAVLAFSYLLGAFPHSFAFFFSILLCWALQVQLLLQIIINRICLLWSEPKHKKMLKYSVTILITLINITVFCIWIPARLQVSREYVEINQWWDRFEKCMYLVIDLSLNILFIRTVNARLIAQGLERYRPLLVQNTRLIVVSVAMDVFLIGMMSLRNSFVYMIIHPVAYMVKLSIEMALSTLIVQIVSAKRSDGLFQYRSHALEIAVHTKVQTVSQAVAMEDFETGGKTRTPARPDLHARLEKLRADRRAKLEAKNGGGEIQDANWRSFDRAGSNGINTVHEIDEIDEKEEAIILGDLEEGGVGVTVLKQEKKTVNFRP